MFSQFKHTLIYFWINLANYRLNIRCENCIFFTHKIHFTPKVELEVIARQTVEASRLVISASISNIGRNSGVLFLKITQIFNQEKVNV